MKPRPALRRISVVLVLLSVACQADRIASPDAPEAVEPETEAEAPATTEAATADAPSEEWMDEGLLGPVPDLSTGAAPLAAAPSTAPSALFPLVFVRKNAGRSQGAVTDNLADAVDRVRPGGTIRVFDGTFEADGVVIDRPLTMEPGRGASPVIATEGTGTFGLVVSGVPSGVVTFRGLTFSLEVRSASFPTPISSSILALRSYDRVVVEDAHFQSMADFDPGTLRGAQAVGVIASGQSGPGAGRVEVLNSTFRGGSSGVYAVNGGAMDVTDSDFADQWFSGIQYQNTGSGRAEGNTLSGCGWHGCVRAPSAGSLEIVGNEMTSDNSKLVRFGVFAIEHPFLPGIPVDALIENNRILGSGGSPSDPAFDEQGIQLQSGSATVRGNEIRDARTGIQMLGTTGVVEDNELADCPSCVIAQAGGVSVLDNTFTIDASYPSENVITAREAVEVTGNVIEGVGGARNPADMSTWPIGNAVLVEFTSTADLSDNEIRGAWVGLAINIDNQNVSGLNNVIDGSNTGIELKDVESMSLHSSDFTNYRGNFIGDPDTDLTCNWWGSVLGPENTSAPDPSVFTPWAREPVAGSSTTTCSGGPPEVVRVEDGVTDLTSLPPTLPTITEGYDAVVSGGTVLIADGTHVVHDLHLSRPVTFEAEGPGRPVVDAEGSAGAFNVGNVDPGTVAFRGLEFVNGTDQNINFSGVTFDRIVIEDNVLHPASGNHLASALFSLGATGNEVVVRNNAFQGGQVGIHADYSNGVMESNSFTGQAVNAVRFGSTATNLRVADNTLLCGGEEGCISLIPTGDVEVLNNRIEVAPGGPFGAPIDVAAVSALIQGNEVRAPDPVGDRSDPGSYSIGAAIHVFATGSATVSGNRVRGAFHGLAFGSNVGAANGRDNVATTTASPVGVGERSTVTIRFSDVTDYDRGFDVAPDGSADLTCNWWGSTDGPSNVADQDPSIYIPWATAPVAGTGATACDGGIGVPGDGLVAHWAGEGTANDVADGHHGTLVDDATFGPGVKGQAFHIPNAEKSAANGYTGSDWVQVPDDAAWDFGSGDFSLATWVNFSSTFSDGPHQQPIFGHSEGPGELHKWGLWLESGALTFHTNTPSAPGHNPISFGLNPSAGAWHHVALTRTGDTWRFYVDGSEAKQVHDTTPVPDADTPLNLGKAEDTWLEGFLDEAVVYHRALTPADVFGLFLDGSP